MRADHDFGPAVDRLDRLMSRRPDKPWVFTPPPPIRPVVTPPAPRRDEQSMAAWRRWQQAFARVRAGR